MRARRKKRGGVWLTLLPLYLFTLVFVAGPLVYMLVLSFQTRAEVWGVIHEFTTDNYQNILQPVYLNTFLESFRLAIVSTLLICAIGYPSKTVATAAAVPGIFKSIAATSPPETPPI